MTRLAIATRWTVLALALALTASATDRGPAIAGIRDALGLTAQQVSALGGVQQDLREDVRPVLGDLRSAQRELRAAQGANEPNESVIQMLEARIANSSGWMETIRLQAVAEARATLTPEQTTSVDALTADTSRNPLVMQAVRWNLLDRSQIELGKAAHARANQGDFRSDGRRR